MASPLVLKGMPHWHYKKNIYNIKVYKTLFINKLQKWLIFGVF